MTTKQTFHGSRSVRWGREARHVKRHRAMRADQFGLSGWTPSESRDGLVHRTFINADGTVHCTCEDAKYRHTHQRIDDPSSLCKHGKLLVAALVDAHRLRTQEVA